MPAATFNEYDTVDELPVESLRRAGAV